MNSSEIPTGLTSQQAAKYQKEFGFNEIVNDKAKFLVLKLLWHQLNSLLIYILLVSAAITYFLDHVIDTYVILAVIVLNTLIGFIQEYKASKAVAALQSLVVATAKVYRDGQLREIPSRELVVGDLVLLEGGDRIPADGQLVEAKNLRVIESSLTGEAFPVSKDTERSFDTTAMADRQDRVWMSTFVAAGLGKFVVTEIGSQTAIGQIAKNLKEIKKEKTHFELKTELLAKQMSIIAIGGALLTFIIGYFFRGYSFVEIFTFSVASLVSGVPEGMPAIIAIVLATGASRMAKKNTIVRSLPSTETLSVVDIIATDKTGTLTQNTMTVKEVHLSNRVLEVTGEGWEPRGEFFESSERVLVKGQLALQQLALAAGLCSRARLINKGKAPQTSYTINGDPTEGALLVLAHKAGLAEKLAEIEIVDELPFDQSKKLKAVLARVQGKKRLFVSGAAESVVALSSLSSAKKKEILAEVELSSRQARRVIALASVEFVGTGKQIQDSDLKNLHFLGFVGMIDPPRLGAKEAVQRAKLAGIRVIMKTGDHQATAIAIAKQVGILEENPAKTSAWPLAMTGVELAALSAAEFEQVVEQVSVFARLTPDMKLRILETLQKLGHVVAMTGDGVNDVLALKKADIGIAMGKIGTDAARESSDLILADDNFASLVGAVEEGRIIFTNTRQASAFLVTTNFAENVIILSSILFALPLPLLASQILWLNLVTDGVVDVALAAEPGHGKVLRQKPKQKGEGVLSRKMLGLLIPVVVAMVLSSLLVFLALLPEGIERARTAAFCAMCFTQLINIFNMRSLDLSIFEIGWLSNKYVVAAVLFSLLIQYLAMSQPFLMGVFRFEYLTSAEVVYIFLLSMSVLLVGEANKLWRSYRVKFMTAAHKSPIV